MTKSAPRCVYGHTSHFSGCDDCPYVSWNSPDEVSAVELKADEYLIRKGGAYYRPDAAGYTNNVAEAGRYSLEDAIRHSHPNGPDGRRDGITYMLAPMPARPPQGDAASIALLDEDSAGEMPCDACGRANPVWFAPSPVWNLAVGGPAATDDPGGFLCPICFIEKAEAAGIMPTGGAWLLTNESHSANLFEDHHKLALFHASGGNEVAWDEVEAIVAAALSATPSDSGERMRGALRALLERDILNTCRHEDTHRGGAIWEICDGCGAKWADDEGGKPDWQDPPEWTAARAALGGQP